MHVKSTLFQQCEALTTSYENDGGGGMYIWSVSTEVLISSTDVIGCAVRYDGGGVNMWSCYSTRGLSHSFQDCHIIDSHGNVNLLGKGNEGGDLMLWGNRYSLVMTEMIIKGCYNYYGGGIQHYYAGTPTSSPVQFSFFNGNSATFGKDAYINNTAAYSVVPFFYHSFSFGTGTDNVMEYPTSNRYLNWVLH